MVPYPYCLTVQEGMLAHNAMPQAAPITLMGTDVSSI